MKKPEYIKHLISKLFTLLDEYKNADASSTPAELIKQWQRHIRQLEWEIKEYLYSQSSGFVDVDSLASN